MVARALAIDGRGALVVRERGRIRARVSLAAGLVVVGAGKGAAALAVALERRLGAAIVGGLVVVPPGGERRLHTIELAYGGHPVPDRASVRATRRLLALLAGSGRTPVLVVLTGGASALLTAPVAGVTLAAERRTVAALLASGVGIEEMNAVRKHLSAVTGGRLAARLARRPAVALVLSDVPGDDLSVVASGPTVGDPTTFGDALAVLRRAGIVDRVPPAVRARLARGARGRLVETPKPGAAVVRRLPTVLLASNATARAGAARAARRTGLRVAALRAPLTGPTVAAAEAFARRLARIQARAAAGPPTLVVAGGETTVRLDGAAGRGGRNQEFALAVARALADRPGWALLSVGTDGIDGPTDAAGGYADGRTRRRAARLGRSLDDALARHDAYPLLAALGDLVRTGPTGTNVADLKLALVWRPRDGGAGAV